MEYKVDTSLDRFEAWSGGKSTLDTIIEKGDCDEVEEFLEEIFCDRTPSETEINDVLWFEADAIAEHLGYRDWEAYEDGWSERDLEDAEDWFHDLDEEELSEIYRERAEDEDEDDYLSDAVDWWDELSDKKKVEVWNENA